MSPPPPSPPPPPVIPREAWAAAASSSTSTTATESSSTASPAARPTVNIGGRECSLQPLVGRPFGSIFHVEPCEGEPGKGKSFFGCLVSCADAPPPDHYDDDGDTDDDNDDVGGDGDGDDARDDDETQYSEELDENRDNRSLIDNNTAQALSGDDIETMKRNGVSGNTIVEALIANSSTFGKKTLQSQEKYKLKKQKKHAPKLLLRRPSTRSICEANSKKDADRIGFMRLDVLSLLLSMANVGAYSDVLVVDMVGGLVVGAVAERLGGTGYVCSTYLGPSPNSIDIIRQYNFSTVVTSRIVQSPFSDLCSLRNSGNASCVLSDTIEVEGAGPSAVSDESTQSYLAEPVDVATISAENVQPIEVEVSEPSTDEHLNQSGNPLLDCRSDIAGTSVASRSLKAGKAPSSERMKYWKEHGFSSLIVAAPEHEVGSLVTDLLPLLSYSAPFAVYHQHLEISEPWFREYQVFPSRTHPHMRMKSFGVRTCTLKNEHLQPTSVNKQS
ncbi:hypothetical protein ACQ4PT_007056 [Festuca glaucescens]